MCYRVDAAIAGRAVRAIAAGPSRIVMFPVELGSRDGARAFALGMLTNLPDGASTRVCHSSRGERVDRFVKHGDVTWKADDDGEPTELADPAPSPSPVMIPEFVTEGTSEALREVSGRHGRPFRLGVQLGGQLASGAATVRSFRSTPTFDRLPPAHD